MGWVEHDYADAQALAQGVADLLATTCETAIADRGRAFLALAGGRTPWPAYRSWAGLPLPWSQIELIATDERCVPHSHPACNTAELIRTLDAADGVRISALTSPDGEPEQSLAHALALLASRPEAFDAVLLGMGNDGHIASLFPGAVALPAALAADAADACRVDPQPLPPEAPFPRISLSLPRLLRSRALHLLISGTAKRAVLRQAQLGAAPLQWPVSALLHAPQAQVHIHWSPT
jgi:6-phosphogluconolactonase